MHCDSLIAWIAIVPLISEEALEYVINAMVSVILYFLQIPASFPRRLSQKATCDAILTLTLPLLVVDLTSFDSGVVLGIPSTFSLFLQLV